MRTYPMPLPIATYHPRGCWRCDPLSAAPYGAQPTPHTETTPSCGVHYAGVDGETHHCNRPVGHDGLRGDDGLHSAADYR